MKVLNSYYTHGENDLLLKDFKDLYKNRNNNLEKEIGKDKIITPSIKRSNTEYIDITLDNSKINNSTDNGDYIDEDFYGFQSPDDSILKKYKDTRIARLSFLFKQPPNLLNKLKEQVAKRSSKKFQSFKNINTIHMSPKAKKRLFHDV